jgi:hypothetical protein
MSRVADPSVSAHGGSPSAAPRIIRATERIVASPWVAYVVVIALQLRVIWNVWKYKDLISGDTSSYFLDAVSWTHGIHDDIVWSPLYTDVWGTVLAVFRDNVYASEMALRVGVVVAAAVLVLAIMRSLLSPAIALIIALWWTIVAANYNVLYEVHLFGVLPILIAALVVARRQTRGALGVALAILLATTILLRNELLLATLIFAGFICVHELRRRHLPRDRGAGRLKAYGVPVLVAIAVAGALYSRSFDQGHQAVLSFRAKQDLNLCQVYAFNYQQRHPTSFTGNAFTECQPLMRQVFGRAEPSFLAATLADPRAMAAFVAWNGRLLGSGLQVSLFNATSTADQPDYRLVETGQGYALVLSLILLALWIAGAAAARRDSRYWRREWFPTRKWILILLGAECVTTLAVVLSERPRPEYIYSLTISLMAFAGLSVAALLRNTKALRAMAPIAVGAAVTLLAAMPSFYRPAPRPLLDGVQHLEVVASRLQQAGSVLITAQQGYELCAYLAATNTRHCTSPSWPTLEAQLASGTSIEAALNQANATAIYVEPVLMADPSIAKLVSSPQRYGWRELASGTGDGAPWHILVRAS